MEKKKKCGGVSEVLGEQVIVGLGAVNLTPKADEKEQKLSKALQHNQVKPEDESPHKSEAVLMVKKDINDRDDATSSSQHTAGTVFNLWPKHFRPMKSPPVPLTDAEVAQRMQAGLRDFRKGESARRKYLKEREEAERELVVSRLRSMGFCSQEDNS
ncbi:hypothetical protein MKW92_050365 [Papaver armeniacum]|nr:hypothetical protein MKW92_020430 [Papaver armeniacum]KAI3957246.1 hypothetical protein MKW92_050365 [Papaver armeniacum]